MKYIGLSLLVGLSFIGCTKSLVVKDVDNYIVTQESKSVATKTDISANMAYDRMQSEDELIILDVRNYNEIALDGKIKKSILIPLPALGLYLNKLDKNKQIIVYCHTGNRSLVAMDMLYNAGFSVANILGGIEAWKANHLPVKYK